MLIKLFHRFYYYYYWYHLTIRFLFHWALSEILISSISKTRPLYLLSFKSCFLRFFSTGLEKQDLKWIANSWESLCAAYEITGFLIKNNKMLERSSMLPAMTNRMSIRSLIRKVTRWLRYASGRQSIVGRTLGLYSTLFFFFSEWSASVGSASSWVWLFL